MKFSRKSIYTASFITTAILVFLSGINTSIPSAVLTQIKLGGYIAKTLTVPKTHVFEYTSSMFMNVNSEWLYDVMLYITYLISGFAGVQAVSAGITALALIIFGVIALLYNPGKITYLLFLMTAVSVMLNVSPHSVAVSVLFTGVFILLIELFRRGKLNGTAFIAVVAIMQVIWTNSHNFFLIGPAVLLIYLVDSIVLKLTSPRDNPNKQEMYIAIALAASLIATIVNPYGWKIYLGVLDYFWVLIPGENIIRANVSSYYPVFYTDFKQFFSYKVYIALLFVCLMSFITHMRVKVLMVLLFILNLFLAFNTVISLILSSCIMLIVTSHNFSSSPLTVPSRVKDFFVSTKVFYISGVILLSCTAIFIVMVVTGKIYSINRLDYGFGFSTAFGETYNKLGDYLKTIEGNRVIFNTHTLGDGIAWELFPKTKVFLTSKIVAHQFGVFKQYNDVLTIPAGFDALVKQYNIGYAVLDISSQISAPLTDYLYHHTGWKLAFVDNTAVVFKLKDREKIFIGKKQVDENYQLLSAKKRELLQNPAENVLSLKKQYASFAFLCYWTKNYRDTIDVLSFMSSLYPASADYLSDIGFTYLVLSDFKTGMGYLQKALEADPKYGNTYWRFGSFYQQNNDNFRAEAYYKRAVKYAPGLAPVWVSLGELYLSNGDLKQALRVYTKLSRMYPYSQDIWQYLGAVYTRAGDNTSAEKCFTKARKLASW
ncbi:MAG: tetratricopeptide repeat protein [Elusimicrobiota bacterium]